MDIGEEIAAFATIQSRLTAALSIPSRPWSLPVSHRGILLHGPRGIGKTHYLLRHARETAGFYLSTDQPPAPGRPLSEWTEYLISRGHQALYLDEIHLSPDWAAHLKVTYDAHPDVSIMVSRWSSLLATTGLADLSRRFVSTCMPYLSFREYLVLRGEVDFGLHDAFHEPPEWMYESAGMTLHAETDERRGDLIVSGRTKQRKSADLVPDAAGSPGDHAHVFDLVCGVRRSSVPGNGRRPRVELSEPALIVEHQCQGVIVRVFAQCIQIGLPAAIGQAVPAFGFTVLQGIVNTLGTAVVAAFGIGNRIVGLFNMPAMGFSQATASIVGRCLGAKRPDLAITAVKQSVLSVGAFQRGGDTKPVMILNITRLWAMRGRCAIFWPSRSGGELRECGGRCSHRTSSSPLLGFCG